LSNQYTKAISQEERDKRLSEIDSLISLLEQYVEKYESFKNVRARLVEMYVFGDRVGIVKTCPRGCCVDSQYTGIVVGIEDDGSYVVQDLSPGDIHRFVSPSLMSREVNP
jgi:phosphatidylserine decarboxylase